MSSEEKPTAIHMVSSDTGRLPSEYKRMSEAKNPFPMTSSDVGTLPSQYKRMSDATRNSSTPVYSNKMYLIIPFLISLSLIWFAWSQWNHPPQILQKPVREEDLTLKKRVWWMPDLLKTLPPFVDSCRMEKFSKKYNISSCVIDGNFVHVNAAVFCYLSNPEQYKTANKTISTDLHNHGLCGRTPPLTLTGREGFKNITDTRAFRIAIIQQPLERFARLFYWLCEKQKRCFDCKDNVACFMRKMIIDLRKLAEGLQGPIRTSLTNNFGPQTWNCHFNKGLHQVKILKLGGNETEKLEFVTNLNGILNERGVDLETQKVIKEEVMKIPLKLSEGELKIMATVKNDGDLYTLFRQLYEHDFTIFGYPL